jgi:hypothetical protein
MSKTAFALLDWKKSKFYFLLFNDTDAVISIDGELIERVQYAKHLGVYIDDKLMWSYHVAQVIKSCCERIGRFKKIIPFLPNSVSVQCYNAFIRSCFSYGLLFWFSKSRSGRWKLISVINRLITLLAIKYKLSVHDFVVAAGVCDIWKVHKMQSLAFMFDIVTGRFCIACFQFEINNLVHGHFTRSTTNIHVNTVTLTYVSNLQEQMKFYLD